LTTREELAEPMTPARFADAINLVAHNKARAWGSREIDLTRVLAELPHLPSRLPTAFVVWVHIVCEALLEVPLLNSRWTDGGIRVFNFINIGFEVPTGRGRLVPVIKDAGRLALPDLASSLADASQRAAAGYLSPADCEHGTFTVGFGGDYGATLSRPLLHDGQAGIYTLGAIRKVARVVNDAIAIRHVSNASLTFDHRILDGSTSSRFQNLVKSKLESWRYKG
jgi:pyruvate dehydrogenase E2 component (dihydrolipoamide acetyltransferase)